MTYRDNYRAVERESLWTLPRAVFSVFVLMVIMYGLGFLVTGGDLAIYRFWAPKQANAQREVFMNSNSYVQGKIIYLSRLREEYQTSDDNHKRALQGLILSEASTVDNNKLPPDLSLFIQSLKEN